MPVDDSCHDQVTRALIKAGWLIEAAPYQISTPERTAFIDIQARRGNNGSREHGLFVEVKCFPDRKSTTRDLYTAIGQYLIYQALIDDLEQEIPLFLAVPADAYAEIFDAIVQRVVRFAKIKLVIVDVAKEEITQWIW